VIFPARGIMLGQAEECVAALTPDAIEDQLDAASRTCTQHSVQLTELRRTVLGLVLQADRPVTAYQLLDRLKETRKSAAPPTVYRALEFLIDNKLIHKVERLNAFIACTESGQHVHLVQFLICRTCNNVTELEDRSVTRSIEQAATAAGFRPSSSIIEIEGICASCFAKEAVLF
jgi:Fur family zinc uptake transcriptional regulator